MSTDTGLSGILERLSLSSQGGAALICDREGLLLGCTGDTPSAEILAGLVSMVEDVVTRSERMNAKRVDEVTLLDEQRERLVIRPLDLRGGRYFLVLRLGAKQTWRRNTNEACRAIAQHLGAA